MAPLHERAAASSPAPLANELHGASIEIQKAISAMDQIERTTGLPPKVKRALQDYVRALEQLLGRLGETEMDLSAHEKSE